MGRYNWIDRAWQLLPSFWLTPEIDSPSSNTDALREFFEANGADAAAAQPSTQLPLFEELCQQHWIHPLLTSTLAKSLNGNVLRLALPQFVMEHYLDQGILLVDGGTDAMKPVQIIFDNKNEVIITMSGGFEECIDQSRKIDYCVNFSLTLTYIVDEARNKAIETATGLYQDLEDDSKSGALVYDAENGFSLQTQAIPTPTVAATPQRLISQSPHKTPEDARDETAFDLENRDCWRVIMPDRSKHLLGNEAQKERVMQDKQSDGGESDDDYLDAKEPPPAFQI